MGTMKRYDVTQATELKFTHRVVARTADEAKQIATERTQKTCKALAKRCKVSFGIIQSDDVTDRTEG